MNAFVGAGLAALLLSAILTPALATYARKRRIFMPPIRKRDIHNQPVPRVGGIAVVASFLVILIAVTLISPELLRFTDQTVLGFDQNIVGLVLSIILLSIINVRDDFSHIHWGYKLGAQIAAAALIASFGVKIGVLSNPFGSEIALGNFDWLLVVVWLVGLSNVVNLSDGIDGLAGGTSAITLAVLFALSMSPAVGQEENALVSIIALGAVLGFLPYNLVSARKVFLGDTGAVFLGFIIGVIAIISGGKIATAFLALAIPFLDALVVLFSRIIHKQSPFEPDQRHLHHRLLALGWKPWQILALFYALSLNFGLLALKTQTLGKLLSVAAALTIMSLLVLLYSVGDKRKKHG